MKEFVTEDPQVLLLHTDDGVLVTSATLSDPNADDPFDMARLRTVILLLIEDAPIGEVIIPETSGGYHLIAANALAAQMTGLTVEQMAPGTHLVDLRHLQVAVS